MDQRAVEPKSHARCADMGETMTKDGRTGAGATRAGQTVTRQGDSMIKIEVTTALKDALEHAAASGTAQVALYKDKPVVILSYDEYERLSGEDDDRGV